MSSFAKISLIIIGSLLGLEASASLACKMIWSDSFGQNNVVQVQFRKDPVGLSKDPLKALMQSEIPNSILKSWIKYVQKVQIEFNSNDVRLLGQHGVNDILEHIQEMKTGLRNTLSRGTDNKDLLKSLEFEIAKLTEIMQDSKVRERLRFAGIQVNPADITKPINYFQPSREFQDKIAALDLQVEQVNKQLFDLRYRGAWNIRFLGQFQNNRMRFVFLESLHKLLFDFDRAMMEFRKQNNLAQVDTSQIVYLARQIRKSLIHTDFVDQQIRLSETSFFKSSRDYAKLLRERIESVDAQIDFITFRGAHIVDSNRGLATRLMELTDAATSYYPEDTYDLRQGLKDMITYFEVNKDLKDQNVTDLERLRKMLDYNEAKLQKIFDSKDYSNDEQIKESFRLIRKLRILIS